MSATETAHTPGPWTHDEKLPTSVWANDVWVASTNVETIHSLDEREANARLIAAAPQMLEALEAVVQRGCSCHSTEKEEWHAPDSVLSPGCPMLTVKSAIRAAKGEL